MKNFYFKQLLAALLLLCSAIASAHDFEVGGIYYNITDAVNKTVAVTYSGSTFSEYSNEYTGNVVIPESIVSDGETYRVTSISDGAFYNCYRLTSIEIPNSVTSIGYAAFYNCYRLTSIEIPNSVTSIGESAFSKCDGLKSIEIPNSVTSIGNYAFESCYRLTSIEIPNSVTSIGSCAFWYCPSLTSVTSLIPAENLFAIYSNVFQGVEKEACTLYVPAGAKETYAATKGWSEFTNIVEIPYGKCGENATWALVDGVLTIMGTGDMYDYDSNSNDRPWYDYNLEITSVVIESGITSIGNSAFYGCDGLTSIEIPNSVTGIGVYAFGGCESLDEVHITDLAAWCNIVFFNYNANPLCCAKNLYLNGTLVTDLIIPEGVTAIKSYAFSECSSLTSITIPNSVTSIGYLAFLRCYGLTSITIPENVTYIETDAFDDCWNLTSITSLIPADKLHDLDGGVFGRVDRDACTLYVPAGAKDTYAATAEWSTFKNIKEIIEEPFTLTISAAKYATLYLDYDAVIPAGVRVYYAEKIEGETLMMERINDVIPANTAVIVTGAAGTYIFEQTFEKIAAIENNLFRGSVEDTYITPEKGTKYYVLSIVDGVVGMYLDELAGGTFKNNAHKAYLPIFTGESLGIFDTTVNAPDVQLSNRYTFNFGGVTAIESITTTASDEAIYNLNGVRVENPTKGIYIVNGKKVVF